MKILIWKLTEGGVIESNASDELQGDIPTNSTDPPLIGQPCQSSPEVTSQYQIPARANSGTIPPARYEPDIKAKTKYPITNRVSYHCLSKSRAPYTLQLSSISIPSRLEEDLRDTRRTQAMAEEMAAS